MAGFIIVKLGEDLRMKIIQDNVGKERDFTTGFFVGSFSAIAKENRDKFLKHIFPMLQSFQYTLSLLERNFIKMFNESGRSSDSVIWAPFHRWVVFIVRIQ